MARNKKSSKALLLLSVAFVGVMLTVSGVLYLRQGNPVDGMEIRNSKVDPGYSLEVDDSLVTVDPSAG